MTLIGRDVRVGACLFAGDMDSMVRFYRDTLGFHTQKVGISRSLRRQAAHYPCSRTAG
jgi:hypothetical protein